MERVFHHRIWQEFLALMHGTANTAENCGKAYVKLCRTFPEGLYHGYSYPNLQKGEDYTREILSGKRGEPGSVSVAESDGQEEEDGLDLGSGAGSDREEGDEDMDSQVNPTDSACFPAFVGRSQIPFPSLFFYPFLSLVPPACHTEVWRRGVAGQHAFPQEYPEETAAGQGEQGSGGSQYPPTVACPRGGRRRGILQ